MKYLKRSSLFFLPTTITKTHFHSQIKPQKPNVLLKGYVKSKSTQKAFLLFRGLLRKGANNSSIDSFSLLYVVKSCTIKPSKVEGKQFHDLIIKLGFQSIIFLQSALISMYGAIGSVEDAHQMFDEILIRNVICWTSLISTYVDNGKPSKALKLFREMQMENLEPDQVTVTVVISACVDLGALEMGEWIHAYIRRKQGFEIDLCLNNALINMYSKCGDIKIARRIFDKVKIKDVTTWTSMIVGHAIHGEADEALKLFEEMINGKNRSKGSKPVYPNEITFIGVLTACSHGGLVKEGFQHLESMTKEYGLKPTISHYGCIVDLLCRAGLLKEAHDFIMEMPITPNAVIWRTLLGACSLHGNTKLGANVRARLFELDPGYTGDDIIMSNTYAAAGMWDEKIVASDRLKHRRAPGCSSIEVDNGVHEFVVADKNHPRWREMYRVLGGIMKNMKTSNIEECHPL